MDEQEWLAGTNTTKMLAFLEGKGSPRKFRLFACACVRRVWHLLPRESLRQVVEVAEQDADGDAEEAALRAALRAINRVRKRAIGARRGGRRGAVEAAYLVLGRDHWVRGDDPPGGLSRKASFYPMARAMDVECHVRDAELNHTGSWSRHLSEPHPEHAHLLRDVFGNPFRPPAPLPAALLAWNGGTIPKLARSIYEDRRFDDLPVLADALEEAGCTDADLLGHCRGPGPHVRACWAVDLLTGRS